MVLLIWLLLKVAVLAKSRLSELRSHFGNIFVVYNKLHIYRPQTARYSYERQVGAKRLQRRALAPLVVWVSKWLALSFFGVNPPKYFLLVRQKNCEYPPKKSKDILKYCAH